jgi:hypothetical protein
MGLLSALFALGTFFGAPEQAQAPLYDLKITGEMRFSNRPGGLSAWTVVPLAVGKPVRRMMASISNNCGFSAGGNKFDPDAVVGWTIDTTTLASTPEHVVVRIRWVREQEQGKRSNKAPEEATVLLRPGDDLPLDSIGLPTVEASCQDPVAVLLITAVAREPVRERVVATRVWLVHRQPGGQEKTQQVDLRSSFDSEVPFFFDEVKVGSSVLDVFGKLRPRSTAPGLISLEFSADRRLTTGGADSDTQYLGTGKVVILSMGPEGVTEYQIPIGTAGAWQAFAGHSLAVRVQTRRIR